MLLIDVMIIIAANTKPAKVHPRFMLSQTGPGFSD
jgi:hypothetical protein